MAELDLSSPSIRIFCPLCGAWSDHAEIAKDITLNQKTVYRIRRCGSCQNNWHSYEQPVAQRLHQYTVRHSKDPLSPPPLPDLVKMRCPLCDQNTEQEAISYQLCQKSVRRTRCCASCEGKWWSYERSAPIAAQRDAERKARSARPVSEAPAPAQRKTLGR